MIQGQPIHPSQLHKNGIIQFGQYQIRLIFEYDRLKKYYHSLQEQYQKELICQELARNKNQQQYNMMGVKLRKIHDQKIHLNHKIQQKNTTYFILSQQKLELNNTLNKIESNISLLLRNKKDKEQKIQNIRKLHLQQLMKKNIIQNIDKNRNNQKQDIQKQINTLQQKIKQQNQKIIKQKNKSSSLQTSIQQQKQKNLLLNLKLQQEQNKISQNTKLIQNKLNNYSNLVQKYQQLKAIKKNIEQQKNNINKQKQQIQNCTLLLQSYQQKLSKQTQFLIKNINQQNIDYQTTKNQYSQQIIRKNNNQECLQELKGYIIELKDQNKTIQTYIQKIFRQDQCIKGIIDSKHFKINKSSYPQSKKNIDKSKIRIISKLFDGGSVAQSTYPQTFYQHSKYQSNFVEKSHRREYSTLSKKN